MEITREQLIERVKQMYTNKGFGVSGYTDMNGLPLVKDDDIDVTFKHEAEFHPDEGYILFNVSMSVSLCRCGGAPSVDELHALAYKISKAAAMMEAFNLMEYVIKVEVPKRKER